MKSLIVRVIPELLPPPDLNLTISNLQHIFIFPHKKAHGCEIYIQSLFLILTGDIFSSKQTFLFQHFVFLRTGSCKRGKYFSLDRNDKITFDCDQVFLFKL
jgi:hypothetical protein